MKKPLLNIKWNQRLTPMWKSGQESRFHFIRGSRFAGFLLIFSFFSSGFAFPNIAGPVYDNIKQQAISSFSDIFADKVTIGNAGGRIIGRIALNDVKIGDHIQAKKIVIDFNPVKFLMSKGDVVPAITSINVFGGQANIVRDQNGNIHNFLKPAKPGEPAIPFRAKLILNNCKADFADLKGLPYCVTGKEFRTKLEKVNGSINLSKMPRININIKASADNSDVAVKGGLNTEKQKYNLKISAQKLDLGKWGVYVIPFVEINEGYASVALNLNDKKITLSANGVANKLPFSVDGQAFDKLGLKVNLKDADFERLKNSFPGSKIFDLKGRGDANLNIYGEYNDIKAAIGVKAREAEFYNQKLSGAASLLYSKNILSIEKSNLQAYGGYLLLAGKMDFSSNMPTFNVSADLNGLNLKKISGDSPVISGILNGKVEASGNLNNFLGKIEGEFSRSSVLGQSIESGQSKFHFENGKLKIDSLSLNSAKAGLTGFGELTSGLDFSISANASGIKLKGEGILGAMQANIDSFAGSISFKLDKEFLRAPLKKINASGNVNLSEIKLGEQEIDSASGEMSLSQGKIGINNAQAKKGSSIFSISGEAGAQTITDINLYGRNVQFSDLKILNYFLPPDYQNPNGLSDMNLKIYGKIDKLETVDQLLDLYILGKMRIYDASIGGVYVRDAYFDAGLENRNFNIRDARVKTANSDIQGHYVASKDSIDTQLSGRINLIDFAPAIKKYGELRGAGSVDMNLKGSKLNPKGSAKLNLTGVHLNNIDLDSVDGSINFGGNKISTSRPITILSGNNRFRITGAVKLSEGDKKEEPKLNIELENGNLQSLPELLRNIYLESLKISKPFIESNSKIDASDLTIKPPVFQEDFYKMGKYSGFADYFKKLSQEIISIKKQENIQLFEKMAGYASGKLVISGVIDKPRFALEAVIKNGLYGKYAFDSLSAKAESDGSNVTVKKLTLNNKDGRADLWGEISKDGEINLNIRSSSLPMDIFKLAFDRQFSGRLDLNGQISGTIKDPAITAKFKGSNGELSGIKFDEISGDCGLHSEIASLTGIKMTKGDKKSTINGSFGLNGNADLSFKLRGESIGLVNLFTDEIQWKGGDASGEVIVLQNDGKANVDGYLAIKNGNIFVKKLNSNIVSSSIDIKADNDIVTVNKLTGIWYGPSSRYLANYISAAGAINVNSREMSWLLAQTRLSMDFPGIYRGDVEVKDAGLSGTIDNMTVNGQIDLNDGLLYLPAPPSGGMLNASPLNFDLLVNFNKNVYLSAGEVFTTDLSNIFLNMEMIGDNIKISGNLSDPRISGKIVFKRGTINILSRDFALLSQENQKQFYSLDLDKISENYALFKGEGAMPYLKLSAMTNVAVQDKNDPSKTKNAIIISSISGSPQSKDELNNVNIAFDSFEEDKTKAPPQFVKGNYSDQDIKVMLLPDFVKSLTGIEKGKSIEASSVVADYLNSRIQVLVFRGLERSVEKALGLENLTLEYNFGNEIRKSLSGGDSQKLEPGGFGVGFAKGFFDKLYIDVRYSQGAAVSAGARGQQFNYQLKYKLTPAWSVAYYREPASFYDLNSGYYKTTLEYGRSF